MKKRIAKFLKDDYVIVILALIFFVIKALYLTKVHTIIWDEAVYLGLGKYLYSFGKLGFWEIIRPIGLPLILGAYWKLGLDYIFFSELTIILFSTAAIILTYLIGKKLFNKRVGIIAAFLLALTSVFFLYTNYILTGIPSASFILLGVYIYLVKANKFLSGLFCGIGALFRFPNMVVLSAVGLTLLVIAIKQSNLWEPAKKGAIFFLGFLAAHIPYFIFNFFIYNRETSKIYHAVFRPWILAFSHQYNPAESIAATNFGLFLYNIFYYLIQLLKENTLLIFLIPGLAYIFRKKLHENEGILLILSTFFVYLIYFTYISNKQTRFMLVFLPYACLIAAFGFYRLFTISKKDRIKVLLVIFVIISIIGVGSRNINYYDWRLKEELPISRDYYKFFADRTVEGPILTTDPVPVAYVDAKFIPFYFSVDLGKQIYEENINSSFAIIYSPESFYCEDEECEDRLHQFSKKIREENRIIFSDIYGERAYYIYLNTDFK